MFGQLRRFRRVLLGVLALSLAPLAISPVGAARGGPEDPGPITAIERVGAGGETVSLLGTPYLTGPSSAAADDVVLDFIRSERKRFDVTPAQIGQLVVRSVSSSPSGATHVALGQEIAGLRVVTPGIVATLDAEGRLVAIAGTIARGQAVGRGRLNALDAVSVAGKALGLDLPKSLPEQAARGNQRRFENTFALTSNPNPVTVEPVWFADDNGKMTIAFETDFEVDGDTWVNTFVDAQSGAILQQSNRYHDAGPEGTVWTGQHPEDSPARAVTPFSGIDGSWVTDRVTTGNNVVAYRDLQNTNAIGYQPQTPASGDPDYQHFNYPWTDAWRTNADGSNASLDADLDAAITQLFYYTNVMHDWAYGFGFTEANRNFQSDNFGRGGSGGDPVLAEAQDGWDFGCLASDNVTPIRCRNNANFGTPADGSSPRMQMYMWSPSRPYREGSVDGDVIAHEYGHGISTRLVGGGNTLNYGGHLVHASLGEGWSDIISFLKWGDAIIGEYVTGDAVDGIRRVAYDTSDHTYSDYNPNAGSGHPNGEVWATMVYDIREALGVAATAQLVFDGMLATPGSPDFLDARNGIITADNAAGGSNFCLLWSIFARNGLGLNATFSKPSNSAPTDNFDLPAGCVPVADADGPYTTPEGTDAVLDGTGSVNPSDPTGGTIVSWAWDFDNDGSYDDAVGPNPTFSDVGDDAFLTVGLQVTSSLGVTDEDTTTITVENVAPTVTLDAVAATTENTGITLTGLVSDPGWEDTLTATVDWDDGAGPQALTGVTENSRPDATLTINEPHLYGDDGVYNVQVCATDDDLGVDCTSVAITIGNTDPTATIDEDVYLAHEGALLAVSGASVDPGSDDLTAVWDWDDGTPDDVEFSLVNPPANDPLKSPSIQPRDIAWLANHVYSDACLYTLGLSVTDDDGGTASDSAVVIITGNDSTLWGSGWWMNQYRPKKPNVFTTDRLECYLDIVRFMSDVFDEFRSPLAQRNDAVDVLFVKQNNGSAEEIFDEHLLTAWLNFANGGFDLDSAVDTDGDGIDDAVFFDVVTAAEAVRTNPASSDDDLLHQKDILETMVVG